jgi:hypothetical protein
VGGVGVRVLYEWGEEGSDKNPVVVCG